MSLCTPAATPCMPAAVAPCGPAGAVAAPFDAVLYPNRSLGLPGFYLLMGGIVLVSAALGAAFVFAGAWPVTGFLGLDVLLLYLAFRWNYRAGRCAELIRLDRDGLCVRQVRPDGRTRAWRFEPHWVRVSLDDPPRHDSQLVLSSHGRALAIGAFLTAEERTEVAKALRAALAAHRRVENPDATAPHARSPSETPS
ncbi:MAG: DUF2244 domain-containing protein [Geminicoccaceae bacterium]